MSTPRNGNNTDPKTLSLLLLAIGGIVIFATIVAAFSVGEFNRTAKRCTESADGVVTSVTEELRTRHRRKHTVTYYVYITQYTYNAEGRNRYSSTTISKSDRLPEGGHLEVFYDPEDPDVCYTLYDDPGTSSIVGIIVTMAMGVILFVTGIVVRKKAASGMPKDDIGQLN